MATEMLQMTMEVEREPRRAGCFVSLYRDNCSGVSEDMPEVLTASERPVGEHRMLRTDDAGSGRSGQTWKRVAVSDKREATRGVIFTIQGRMRTWPL